MIFLPEIIDWAFSKKESNIIEITEHFGAYEQDLSKLFEVFYLVEQLRYSNCSNIQEKFADTSSWNKLCSLSSELFFANELINLGFTVSFIPDNDPEWKNKKGQDGRSPDIRAIKDGQELLIEVARISGDETTSEIADNISPLCRKTPFRVEIIYSKEFSNPVISSSEREKREKMIEKFIDEFKIIIKDIDQNLLPQERNICGCQVIFTKPLIGKRGYYSGSVTAAVINPIEKFKKLIAYEIERKAKKRNDWNKYQKNKPYLIALDIQQNRIFSSYLVSWLFGGRCRSAYIEELVVSQAKLNGWRKLLEEVGFSQQTPSPVVTSGLFISNELVSRNVTGVITRVRGKLYCLPNPFAEESINCLNLQELISWPLVGDY